MASLLTLLGFALLISLSSSSDVPPYSPALQLAALVQPEPVVLTYHKGPLMAAPGGINVYIYWYGNFSDHQKSLVSDLFRSFGGGAGGSRSRLPTVASWWATATQYKDAAGRPVAADLRLAKQTHDRGYSLGRMLRRRDLGTLVRRAVAKRVFPVNLRKGLYLVLTSDEVAVERFCVESCGFHEPLAISKHSQVTMGWVGNAKAQCLGECGWPFAVAMFGPPGPPLVAPSGDSGIDGMVVNIAAVLAGSATNPLGNGYFQGDPLVPLEAVTACAGIFGPGAYPGYAGKVLVDPSSKGSFNAVGTGNRSFLLPAIWSPNSQSCRTTLG